MSRENREPIVQVLQAVGNPIRRTAIEALSKGGMRFSQLLASCDLDYDHDTGYFYYHLSELMDKQIVEKAGDAYRLTEFGQNVAKILDSLEKECSFLILERNKGGERRMESQNLETEWIESEWFEFGKGITFDGDVAKLRFHTETSSLLKAITEELHDGLERTRLINFLKGFERWKGPATLMAKDKDGPLGWAKVDYSVSWGSKTGENTCRSGVFAKAFIIIEDIVVAPRAKDRKKVVSGLIQGLLEKGRQTGADGIHLVRVDSEDSAVIEAFRDVGFERFGTSYKMLKRLLDEKT